MKVLIVATTSYAGMGPYVSEIVNTFSPDDDVYYFFHDYEDDFYRKNIKRELHGNSVFFRQANSAVNKMVNLITNRSSNEGRILQVCKEKRIELVHYINGIPSLRMQRKFEDSGIVVLSTVHDLYPHEAKKAWYKMWRQHILYKRLAENLKEARYLVTNSLNQYEELKRFYPDKQVTFHSFPSLVTNEIVAGNEVPKELRGIQKPYILFFGRIEEYKGIHLLYQAFMKSEELHKNFALVIAGSGQLGFERRDDEQNVIIINRYIKDSEVACLYRNAKCVVYPYISATQSGVLSLAFYFRTPVLASDVPFFKNILTSSHTGLLFQTGNADDLTQQLIALLQMDTESMKTAQTDYYRRNYDGKAIRENLLRIYAMEVNRLQ